MPARDSRVVIVGGGAAGITAAIGLARRGIEVLVVEGGVHPGSENWSGAVYFCENLARPQILGEELLKQTPLERRIVRRGILATDGRVAPGVALEDAAAFEHCYTVLRPVFDHDLAEKARILGAEVLSGTTVTALIRDGDRVRGVLTNRGPIHADVVFLAEGDASHLVAREGLERLSAAAGEPPRPAFLQGIKEVLELDRQVIEERFDLRGNDGAAFEILLRNALADGRTLRLNAGAFLYTNRESLSLGIVAPLENLGRFSGDHNRLMEWLKGLPALRPLLEGARTVSFGAKLIRSGGHREIPRLVLDGLAVGGAASGIGVDFPCPNFTGPATFMGYAFSEAVARILEDGGDFSREALERHYLQPVERSHYFADVRHLRRWPRFVESTGEFFGRQVDLLAGAAHVLTAHPGGIGRHVAAARHLFETLPPARIPSFVKDQIRGAGALGFTRGLLRDLPLALWWLIINVVLGFFPRRGGTGGRFLPLFWHDGSLERRPMPATLRYLRLRFAGGLADALHHLYANDGTPLRTKVPRMRMAVISRLAAWDLLLLPLLGILSYVLGAAAAGAFRLKVLLTRMPLSEILRSPFFAAREEARRLRDLNAVREKTRLDEKLALITYEGDAATHIHFHSRSDAHGLPANGESTLFSVCPARVYEKEVDDSLSTSVAVLHENCIRCETCWRSDDAHVDWGRARFHKLVFEVDTSADAWLMESTEGAALADLGRGGDEPEGALVSEEERAGEESNGDDDAFQEAARALEAFLRRNRESPAVLSGADQHLLAELAGEAVERTQDLLKTIGAREVDERLKTRIAAVARHLDLTRAHLEARRFFAVEADLDLLRAHHLPGLARDLGIAPPRIGAPPVTSTDRARLVGLLDERLDRETVAAAESRLAPDEETARFLTAMAARVVPAGESDPERRRTPERDDLLEETARRSPSLATLLARHLAALDVLAHAGVEETPEGLLGLVEEGFEGDGERGARGVAEGVLLGGVRAFVVVTPSGVGVLEGSAEGVSLQITGAIGLRGAGPGILRAEGASWSSFVAAEGDRRTAMESSAWDLVAVARGMGRYLQERALEHAEGRVQFPALFRDLRGRDGIVKFGAVQAMLAGMAQGLEILEALRGARGRGDLAAALALEVVGCSPRGMAYLAGQVLGGTAYSEEDAVCRFYRDASALWRIPRHQAAVQASQGAAWINVLEAGDPSLPDLQGRPVDILATPFSSRCVRAPLETVREALGELGSALMGVDAAWHPALTRDFGRLALHVAALGLLARRTQDALDGESSARVEILLPVLRSFSRRVLSRVRRLVRRLPETERLVALGRRLLAGDLESAAGAAGLTYGDVLADGTPFASGDLFLLTGDASRLCLTPEILAADPDLSAEDERTKEDFIARFERRVEDGLPYTRLVEKLHHVPLEDIRYLLERGSFRMVIPRAHGGLGRKKVSYYLECTRMMRHGDPAQAIIVMGSTSIGTTPILIGLERDLPQARAALEGLLRDPERVEGIAAEIRKILRVAATPQVARVGGMMKALAGRVGKTLQKEKAARPVFQSFLSAFRKAGLAGLRRDLDGFTRGLEAALAALEGWRERVRAEAARLPGRETAHGFYLRLIASGRISAFALTEPSAGSDTARIRTHATLVEVPVERDPRGFYTFVPEGGEERRHLFTYESLEAGEAGVFFIAPDGSRLPVFWQDFAADHTSGDGRSRYVEIGGERIPIHDMGSVQESPRGLVYRYYRVNGAKMWITNGSIAGVMILYARTERGPTAFMLDAHAEGLVVGKDEEKMGQRGSATNELSLLDVRVCVDQIIGIEGRGQENALETLNVGRAGLSVTSVGLMHEIVEEVREGLGEHEPTLLQCLLAGRIALDLVGCESLAWQVVGRFDHEATRGIRMESAFAKANCSEALHRILSRAEEILPPRFALDLHELEKRRRDARVLTIYEGTNEVQRFLLLKDLVDVLDLERAEVEAPPQEDPGRPDLHAARGRVVETLAAVRKDLGSRAWQHAPFQSIHFKLVEAAMRATVVSATVHRSALARRLLPADSPRLTLLEEATQLLAADLEADVFTRLDPLRDEAAEAAAGKEPLAQVLADRMLLASREEAEASGLPSGFRTPLNVAVVIDPRPLLGPHPRVRGGALREPTLILSPADRAALKAALDLKRSGPAEVSVYGVGAAASVDVLEEALALGADRAFLLNTQGRAYPSPLVAEGLCDVIRAREALEERGVDLLIGAEASRALLLPLARRLEVEAVPGVRLVALREGEAGLTWVARLASSEVEVEGALPQVLLLSGEIAEAGFPFDTEGWRRARERSVAVIEFHPESPLEARILPPATTAASGRTQDAKEAPGLEEVVERFIEATGLGGGVEISQPYSGGFEEEDDFASAVNGVGALAVVEADGEGFLRPGAAAAVEAAAALAGTGGRPAGVLVLVPAQEDAALRAAAGEVAAVSPEATILLLADLDLACSSLNGLDRLLEDVLEPFAGSLVFAWSLLDVGLLVGEGRSLNVDHPTLVKGVDEIDLDGRHAVLSGPAFEGRLRFRLEVPLKETPLNLIARAEVTIHGAHRGALTSSGPARVVLLKGAPAVGRDDALSRALREAGRALGVSSLADAEFIIDVGYGIGSRDGIEEVVEPLKAALEEMGVRGVAVGATRKVTMDLGILPESAQIGQTGVAVNPRVILALGVSGAPQHMDFIGDRAVIFAFNRDPEAPLMTWNRTRPTPRVFPIPGDLFEEVPRFLETLKREVKGD